MSDRIKFPISNNTSSKIGKTIGNKLFSLSSSCLVGVRRIAALSLAVCCLNLQAEMPGSVLTPLQSPAHSETSAQIPLLIEHQNEFQGFFQPTRLSVVLANFHADPSILWQTARLYRLDSTQQSDIDALKVSVIQQLKALVRANTSDKTVALGLIDLVNWIENQQFAVPLDLSIDPSATIVNSNANPKLVLGHYRLVTPKQASTVLFIGLGGAMYQTVSVNSPVWQLFNTSKLAALSAVDAVWLVRPNRAPLAINVANWNREHTFANVGAQLFVPLPAAVAKDGVENDVAEEDITALNAKLAELLSYRIVQ